MGLSVPHDLSVVGFDDVQIAAYCDPPLTTVRQPRREIGRMGMTELLALLEGKRKRTGRRITVPHTLIARGSTAAPPGEYAPARELEGAIAYDPFPLFRLAMLATSSSPFGIEEGRQPRGNVFLSPGGGSRRIIHRSPQG